MSPVEFQGSAAEAIENIKFAVTRVSPRARLVQESDNYLRYEFSSFVFRFVDDVEFFVDDGKKLIHFRSASRVGHSDLGANRKRMTKICRELTQ